MWPCNNLTQKYCKTYCQLQLFSSIFIWKCCYDSNICFGFVYIFPFPENMDGIREASPLQVLFMVSLPDGYVRFIKGKGSVWRGRLKGLKQRPNSAHLAICEPRTQGDSHPFLSLIFHLRVQLIPSHINGEALQVHVMWRAAAVSLPMTEAAAPSLSWRAGTADTCNFKREMNTHFSVGANKA